ncbi:MAG TPA: aldehyde dehydrogenase family protein [Thermoanaerobaculia bacterium]|nr:aldehyde dehydrogenase family protein [Thermoanaerobaculia bacterium]
MSAAAVPETAPLLGGERPAGGGGERRSIVDPANGEPIASVVQATPEDVDRAARLADAAWRSDWKRRTPKDRAAILFRLAARIREEADALALLESRNTGKPIGSARGEVLMGADCFEFYAGAVTKFGGSTIPVSARGASVTFREPLGVCGLIVPWNFPFAIATWKIAPALAMGNTVIVKPASDTPLSALRLGELALESGVPPGAFHVLPGPGETVGSAIVSHPLVRKISFTGSTEAGKSVMRLAADGIKRISLELGGKSACLIFEDADLATCLESALWSVFDNAGQDCCARSRFLVQRPIYDRVVAELERMAKAIRVGDPLAPETQMGPLITRAHREKVRGWISIGDAEGARRVTGGEAPADSKLANGSFLAPAIFADVDNAMRIAREEIFGPVVSVIPFSDEADAVEIANASRYGLSGSLYTRDLGRAMRVARAFETGVLSVNSSRSVFLEAPFGGVKESGLGRELGLAALEHYTETKTVFFSED